MIKHQNLPEEDDLWRKLYTILRQFPHKEQVQFALFCAEESNSESSEAKECIRLVKAWLKDPASVTNEELRHAAADATYANAAAWSAYAAAASSATSAANSASYAARSLK